MLDEALFRDALLRQARRTERFEEPFVLVRITLAARRPLDTRWTRVLETLRLTTRDTDVVGWVSNGHVLGLIRHVEGSSPQEVAAGLGLFAQQELAASLAGEGGLESCSVTLDVISPGGVPQELELLDAIHHRSAGTFNAWAKRTLDVIGSFAGLVLLSPVLALVAVAVRATSRGPVVFRQQRVGLGGTPFTMMKFRTMRVDAETTIHQEFVQDYITTGNKAPDTDASGRQTDVPLFKITDDPRVTPVGNFLRRSSLDELPQLWNVLRGDMSLVGPRPPLPYEVACYKPWHWRRVREAKPGLTGLWQVTGRSRTPFEEMVRLDIRYARNPSRFKDLRILLATPKAVLSGDGAR